MLTVTDTYPQTVFIAPLRNKKWFLSLGFDEKRVFEMDWWDEKSIEVPGHDPITIACTPCQHFSGRTPTDRNHTLWSSWVVQQPAKGDQPAASVFFGGDTGAFALRLCLRVV